MMLVEKRTGGWGKEGPGSQSEYGRRREVGGWWKRCCQKEC